MKVSAHIKPNTDPKNLVIIQKSKLEIILYLVEELFEKMTLVETDPIASAVFKDDDDAGSP